MSAWIPPVLGHQPLPVCALAGKTPPIYVFRHEVLTIVNIQPWKLAACRRISRLDLGSPSNGLDGITQHQPGECFTEPPWNHYQPHVGWLDRLTGAGPACKIKSTTLKVRLGRFVENICPIPRIEATPSTNSEMTQSNVRTSESGRIFSVTRPVCESDSCLHVVVTDQSDWASINTRVCKRSGKQVRPEKYRKKERENEERKCLSASKMASLIPSGRGSSICDSKAIHCNLTPR